MAAEHHANSVSIAIKCDHNQKFSSFPARLSERRMMQNMLCAAAILR
jgi:hypothetical protein